MKTKSLKFLFLLSTVFLATSCGGGGQPAHEHHFGEWTVDKAATCVATGMRSHACTECGAVESEEIPIDPNGHKWGEWEVTTPGTCITPSVETRTCEYCADHKETQEGEIDPDNHNWGTPSVKAEPTKKEYVAYNEFDPTGFSVEITCLDCGETKTFGADGFDYYADESLTREKLEVGDTVVYASLKEDPTNVVEITGITVTKCNETIDDFSFDAICATEPTDPDVHGKISGDEATIEYYSDESCTQKITNWSEMKADGVKKVYCKATLEATSNYDKVTNFASAVIEHDWDEEYIPTDHIGNAQHKCSCCDTVEDTDTKMTDDDIDLSKNLYGAATSVVSSSSTCKVTNTDNTIRYDFGTTETPPAGNDKFKIELPKVNYSLYKTGVRFNMNIESYQYFGFDSSDVNKMLKSEADYQRMSVVVLKHGTTTPTYEAILRIFDNGTSTYDDTKTIQEIRINITDTNVIYGTTGLTLYNQLIPPVKRFLIITDISLVDEECAHSRYVTSTECVGEYVCEICGAKSADEIMQEAPINKEITYSASVKSLDATPKACSVQFNNLSNVNYIEYSLSKSGAAVGDRYELEFPHVNYSLYENGVVFEFNKCDSWQDIGLDEQDLYNDTLDFNKRTVTVLHDGDGLKAIYRSFDGTDDTKVLAQRTKTISDSNIINGSKGLPFYSKLHVAATRSIRINKISIIGEAHEHHYITNANEIGYKKVCDICGEPDTSSIMTTSDINLGREYNSYNSCSAEGTTAIIEGAASGIKYTCHEPGGDGKKYGDTFNLGIPLVNYSLYDEVSFTFTTNSWTKIRISDDTTKDLHFTNDRTSFTITVSKNADGGYDAKLVAPATATQEELEQTITLSDDVIQGTSNLIIYNTHWESGGNDRVITLTGIALTQSE